MIDGLEPYATYKDSGVPWLGDVPRHWEVRRLKQLCSRSALYGANVAATSYAATGVRFLRTTDITEGGQLRKGGVFLPRDAVGDYLLTDGDLLISRSGTVGRSFVYHFRLHGPCAYAGYLVRFVPAVCVLPRYVFLFTKTPSFAGFLRVKAVSSTIENVNGEKYANAPLPLPPLPEQSAIVRFIDHADWRIRRYISAKRKLIALLNEQKQAIIHRALTRGLDPNVRLKPSGVEWLGDVPEHWKLLRLKDISPRISGRLVYQPAQYFSEDGVPFIMGNNVTPEGIRWSGVRHIPREINERFAHHALREGDVVTVRVGAPGVTCVVPKEADGLNCGSLMIIRRADRFCSNWLAYTMNSGVVRTQIALVQYGAAQEQINIEDAVNFLVPVPPLEEQRQIAALLSLSTEPLARAVECVAQSIANIREYRTRLIADVVTGKLDVREAASRLPDERDEPEPLDDALADVDDAADEADPDADPEEADA